MKHIQRGGSWVIVTDIVLKVENVVPQFHLCLPPRFVLENLDGMEYMEFNLSLSLLKHHKMAALNARPHPKTLSSVQP